MNSGPLFQNFSARYRTGGERYEHGKFSNCPNSKPKKVSKHFFPQNVYFVAEKSFNFIIAGERREQGCTSKTRKAVSRIWHHKIICSFFSHTEHSFEIKRIKYNISSFLQNFTQTTLLPPISQIVHQNHSKN